MYDSQISMQKAAVDNNKKIIRKLEQHLSLLRIEEVTSSRNSTNLVLRRFMDSTIDISDDDTSSNESSIISILSNDSSSEVSEMSYHLNSDAMISDNNVNSAMEAASYCEI